MTTDLNWDNPKEKNECESFIRRSCMKKGKATSTITTLCEWSNNEHTTDIHENCKAANGVLRNIAEQYKDTECQHRGYIKKISVLSDDKPITYWLNSRFER